MIIPGPPPAALPRHGSYRPGTAVTHPGLPVTRHQSRVHVLRPPGLPLTRGPRMTRGTLRLSPGLRTRAGRTRARTPGQGQAQSTSPEQRHQHYVMLALQSARFTRNMCDLVSHSSSGTCWPTRPPGTPTSAPATTRAASTPTASSEPHPPDPGSRLRGQPDLDPVTHTAPDQARSPRQARVRCRAPIPLCDFPVSTLLSLGCRGPGKPPGAPTLTAVIWLRWQKAHGCARRERSGSAPLVSG